MDQLANVLWTFDKAHSPTEGPELWTMLSNKLFTVHLHIWSFLVNHDYLHIWSFKVKVFTHLKFPG